MKKLYPSLFSAKQLDKKEIAQTLSSEADGFHYDLMDLHFVDNLTGSLTEIAEFRNYTKKPLWVHAMVMEPYLLSKRISFLPNDIYTWHIERQTQSKIFDALRGAGVSPSLAVNPTTPLGEIIPFLDKIDQVLIMGVAPGFSGQKIVSGTMKRIEHLAHLRAEHGHTFRIGIDGGVTEENISQIANAGADDIVLGSVLFNANDIRGQLLKLQNKICSGH
jgi:ribulose-phosphate 3-epimerase